MLLSCALARRPASRWRSAFFVLHAGDQGTDFVLKATTLRSGRSCLGGLEAFFAAQLKTLLHEVQAVGNEWLKRAQIVLLNLVVGR